MGRPDLNEKDQERVRIGNLLMFVCARIIKELLLKCKPWSLEQPQSSRMWLCSCIRKIMCSPVVFMVHTVFCAWGTAWKKPISSMVGNCPALRVLGKTCGNSGVCAYSGKRHQVLEGSGPGGIRWTLIAQPYPPRLCRAFAAAVSGHFLSSYINELDRKSCMVAR